MPRPRLNRDPPQLDERVDPGFTAEAAVAGGLHSAERFSKALRSFGPRALQPGNAASAASAAATASAIVAAAASLASAPVTGSCRFKVDLPARASPPINSATVDGAEF